MAVEAAREVSHHHHGSLEDADEQEILALVVGLDLRRHLAEAIDDLLLGQQDLVGFDVAGNMRLIHVLSLPQGS